MSSPHRILGVNYNATRSEIKQAYRKLCLEWHPDLVPAERKAEAEKVFREISAAYQRLSGGTFHTEWQPAGSQRYTRSPPAWARPNRGFSNIGVAMWLSIPLILVGIYVGQSSSRLAQDMGRPHGLWYPPVNPYLKDEMMPRMHKRNRGRGIAGVDAASDSESKT